VRTSPVAGIFVQIPRVKRLARRQHRHPPSSREDVDDVLTGSPHCDIGSVIVNRGTAAFQP
jgi:hypothetical protein